ncbi:MAG: ABC transporter ATP-binding protein [Calditrichaeota bacterium]|nr:MAG: ABC transporter ATP-binding protein [Calditrichota bacterium]
MSQPIINISNVNKSYGTVTAVRDLNFQVDPGTCFGFLGPNGAGKTTMMHMIYGKVMRNRSPESQIQVFGFDPARQELNIKFISGVVPQENNLDEELNVWQNLMVYAKFYGMSRRDIDQRIDELLQFFELSAKKKAKIKELSGGMKRRLVIARALLHAPKLLILDEPTTGLDPQVRHLIWEKLRQLKRAGLTILLTTHYMEEAFQLCDTILIMDRGEKIVEGAPAVLLAEHIEPYVMEIQNEEVAEIVKTLPIPDTIRCDYSHGTPLLYARSFNMLNTLANGLGSGGYYLRQSNLEDLFLKLTGRALNEQQ